MKNNIKDYITDVMIENNFSGTIIVQDDKKTLEENSYGYANRSEQILNSFDTRFGIMVMAYGLIKMRMKFQNIILWVMILELVFIQHSILKAQLKPWYARISQRELMTF